MLIGTAVVAVDLSGPVHINGDLTVADGQLITLMSNSITSISGTLALQNVTYLSSLLFRSLTSVGNLHLQTVPSLFELGFDSGITSAETVIVEDTFLGSLGGLALNQVTDFTLVHNLRLVTLDISLVNVTGNLNFSDNGQSFRVNLPDLVTVNNLAISNVSQLKIPSLQTIQGGARLETNYFTSFSAPVLEICGGSLSIVDSPDLDNILLPQLSSVGGSLLITNNSDLTAITRLNDLKTIDEDVRISGNLTE